PTAVSTAATTWPAASGKAGSPDCPATVRMSQWQMPATRTEAMTSGGRIARRLIVVRGSGSVTGTAAYAGAVVMRYLTFVARSDCQPGTARAVSPVIPARSVVGVS